MRDTTVIEEDLAFTTAPLAFRRLGVAVLALLAFAAPLALGSVQAWAWGALYALSALALLLACIVWLLESRIVLAPSPVTFIACILAAVGLLQLLPLPAKALALSGPRTLEIHKLLSASWPQRVSLYPASTLEALLKAGLVLMAVLSALSLARTRRSLLVLAGAVVASAVVSSIVGFAQGGGVGEKIYGIVDLSASSHGNPPVSASLDPNLSSGVGRMEEFTLDGQPFFRRSMDVGDVFGPYANSNHFGGLLEIALPLIFALLLALWSAGRAGWRQEGGLSRTTEGHLMLILFFALAAGVVALVYSHSFGAAGGVAVGLFVVALSFSITRGAGRIGSLSAAALVCVALAAAFCIRPGLLGVLPAELSAKFHGRYGIWRVAARMIRDFPLAGSGLGAFAAVAPRYDAAEAKFLHAHNDYLEAAAGLGLPVLALLAVLAFLQARLLARGVASRDDVYCSALSAGALGAMAALAFHSFFDYNLHVPANALSLSLVLCIGTLASLARRSGVEVLGFRMKLLAEGRAPVAASVMALLVLAAAGAAATACCVRSEILKNRVRATVARLGVSVVSPDEIEDAYSSALKASRPLHLDAEAPYHAAALASARAALAPDSDTLARWRLLRAERLAEAAERAPAFTYSAMSALSDAPRLRPILEQWPMASFAYRWHLAATLFDAREDESGFAWALRAFTLAAGDPKGLAAESEAAIAQLVARFGRYDRISAAIPPSFGARLVFARGLQKAGVISSALDEYQRAAERAASTPRDPGLTERSVMEVADALSSGRRKDKAFALYESILHLHPHWQYARLGYATLLSGDGKSSEAGAQIDTILNSSAAGWLKDDAARLRKTILSK